MQASFHVEGAEDLLPPHAMPAALRVCGKLAVLDYVLSKLLAAKHKAGHNDHPFMPPHFVAAQLMSPLQQLLFQIMLCMKEYIFSGPGSSNLLRIGGG